MKKYTIIIIATLALGACKTAESTWSQQDKDTFMKDCTAVDNSAEIKDRCECSLHIMMKKYPNLEEAQKATQRMDMKELEQLFSDCSY